MVDENSQSGLDDELQEAICSTIREMAAPEETSWESLVSVLCLLGPFLSPGVSEGRLAILNKSTSDILFWPVIDCACIAFAFGFGISALRRRNTRGRILGCLVALIAAAILVARKISLV